MGVVTLMTDTGTEDTAQLLSLRLEEAHATLAKEWLDRLAQLLVVPAVEVFPSNHLLDHIPDLIVEIAHYLRAPDDIEIAANTAVMTKASELGRIRFEQRASVHQLMREYQIFAEILERFIRSEVIKLSTLANVGQAMGTLSRALQAVRVLQVQTVDTFVECYTETIDRQTTQLRSFNRLVSHEIRQPLGVLQVLGHMLPVSPEDAQAGTLVKTFQRNVARLGDVADKLERLTRLTHSADNMPSEQTVDVSGMAGEVAHQLADMASPREVTIVVDPGLPLLNVDAGRLELTLMNLLANGIKYADPAKPAREVRLSAVSGTRGPALQVIDNGIGIPTSRFDAIFKQFVRVHAHRDGELGAGGLGLGLSIVRECMDAMGGTVSVASTEGVGTTFTLEWPATARV
jgi:signal transduction histidine kinase